MNEHLREIVRAGNFAMFRHWVADVTASTDTKGPCSDLPAALVLTRLLLWGEERAKGWGVVHDGHYWAVVGHKDWWDHVRLSERQAKRAVTVLEKQGFIETMTRKFHGTPKLHLRANQEGISKRMGELGLTPLVGSPPRRRPSGPGQRRNGHDGKYKTSSSYTEEVYTDVKPASDKSDAPGGEQVGVEACAEEGKNQSKVPHRDKDWLDRQAWEREQVETQTVEALRMKAHERLKQDYGAHPHQAGRKNYKATGQGVGMLWKKHMHLLTGEFIRDWTRAEEAILKRLVEAIQKADGPAPLGSAVDVVDWVLHHWGAFCHKVAVLQGAMLDGSPPAQPHLGFLYKHYAVAVNLYNVHKKAVLSTPVEVIQHPTVEGAKEAVKEQAPAEALASAAEVEAALQEFDPDFKPSKAA